MVLTQVTYNMFKTQEETDVFSPIAVSCYTDFREHILYVFKYFLLYCLVEPLHASVSYIGKYTYCKVRKKRKFHKEAEGRKYKMCLNW